LAGSAVQAMLLLSSPALTRYAIVMVLHT